MRQNQKSAHEGRHLPHKNNPDRLRQSRSVFCDNYSIRRPTKRPTAKKTFRSKTVDPLEFIASKLVSRQSSACIDHLKHSKLKIRHKARNVAHYNSEICKSQHIAWDHRLHAINVGRRVIANTLLSIAQFKRTRRDAG